MKPSLQQYQETLHRHYGQCLEVEELLFDGRSDHQDLVIFHNPLFGRVLALDGAIQTTEKDEFIYHEMLTHVPVLAHGAVKKALVVGVGDGGIIRELTRHQAIEEIVAVEIDQAVIDMCLEYLPNHSAGSLDDPRVRLVIDDGLKFLAETTETFDVIITDSTDPVGPAETLFTEKFYALCRARLNDGGILATQNGVPFMQPEELTNTAERLAPHFPGWHFYHAAVPTYVGGSMAFGWGALDPESRRVPLDELERRFAASGLKTRYYNPAIHQAAFALPQYMLELIGR
ncbi:polyamine aminopropyltransferase [Halotalea alkalilenta]|uniref:polyamine aminopropyltransferase n=1 Tax=Halotalea alkalilenta TaxID=376489 RepID=UPI000AB9BB09|nr:polyamine aminopropyltransferase [Halotalea alkalilenta]